MNLNSTYLNLSSITTLTANYITDLHTYLQNNITAFKSAKIVDIKDDTALAQLIKLSKADSFTCSTNGFTSDSWVPSVSQNPVYVQCNINSGAKSDSNSCPNTADFNSRANGCIGCMDTYDLFKGNSSASNVKSALDTRYTDPSCSTFNT